MPTVGSVDVESAIVVWLTGQLGASIRVVTELPSTLETSVPLVEVGRIGGGDRVLTLDAARVDLTCWGSTRDGARKLSYRVRDLMRNHLPQSLVDGGHVSAVTDGGGPFWLAYDNTKVRRFVVTYGITVHSLL